MRRSTSPTSAGVCNAGCARRIPSSRHDWRRRRQLSARQRASTAHISNSRTTRAASALASGGTPRPLPLARVDMANWDCVDGPLASAALRRLPGLAQLGVRHPGCRRRCAASRASPIQCAELLERVLLRALRDGAPRARAGVAPEVARRRPARRPAGRCVEQLKPTMRHLRAALNAVRPCRRSSPSTSRRTRGRAARSPTLRGRRRRRSAPGSRCSAPALMNRLRSRDWPLADAAAAPPICSSRCRRAGGRGEAARPHTTAAHYASAPRPSASGSAPASPRRSSSSRRAPAAALAATSMTLDLLVFNASPVSRLAPRHDSLLSVPRPAPRTVGFPARIFRTYGGRRRPSGALSRRDPRIATSRREGARRSWTRSTASLNWRGKFAARRHRRGSSRAAARPAAREMGAPPLANRARRLSDRACPDQRCVCGGAAKRAKRARSKRQAREEEGGGVERRRPSSRRPPGGGAPGCGGRGGGGGGRGGRRAGGGGGRAAAAAGSSPPRRARPQRRLGRLRRRRSRRACGRKSASDQGKAGRRSLFVRARKATKIARAWLARRIRLPPERSAGGAYAERLKQYDEQLKSKDVKARGRSARAATRRRRARVARGALERARDYIENYRPFASTWRARAHRAVGTHADEGGGGRAGRARHRTEGRSGQAGRALQLGRLKVITAIDKIERSKMGEVRSSTTRAPPATSRWPMPNGRMQSSLGRERVWDGGRRDGARGGGGGDRRR